MVTAIPLTVSISLNEINMIRPVGSQSQFEAEANAAPLDLIRNELISGAYIQGTFRKLLETGQSIDENSAVVPNSPDCKDIVEQKVHRRA